MAKEILRLDTDADPLRVADIDDALRVLSTITSFHAPSIAPSSKGKQHG